MQPLLVIENTPSDPVGRLADWLDLDLEVRAEPPDSLDGYAGVVVLGFHGSAHEAYLSPVASLLRQAVEREVPTLGICGGHQLLALANGGRVEANPDGPEVGAYLVAKRSAAATDPLFGPLPITPDVVQWHWDAVTALPRGAVQLASSPYCENQAFRLGRLAWGIQFHIEVAPADVARWAEKDAAELAEYGLDDANLDAIVRRVEAVDADVVEVWRPFAEAFAAVVRDPGSVAAPGSPPTSSAAPVTDPAAIRAALAAEMTAARAPLPMPVWTPPSREPS